MYQLTIGLRYLLRKRICILAVLGVAFGVMALIVVHSVMKGFEQNIRSRIRGSLSDLIVEKWGAESFTGYEALIEKLKRIPHVDEAAPRLEGLSLVKMSGRDDYRTAQFVGVDLERECRISGLAEYWSKAQKTQKEANDAHEIVEKPTWGEVTKEAYSPAIVGSELIVLGRDMDGERILLEKGGRITLVTFIGALDHGLLPCQVTGIFKSGMYEYDLKTVYIPLKRAQTFLEKPGRVSAVHVQLDSYDNADLVRAAIVGIPTLREIRRMQKLMGAALGKLAYRDGTDDFADDVYAGLVAHHRTWRKEGNPRYIRACRTLQQYYEARIAQLVETAGEAKIPGGAEMQRTVAALKMRAASAPGIEYRVSTWEDRQRNFLEAVEIERAVTLVIQSFLFLLAWFVIYSILSAMVTEKTRDIGTLKAIGASVRGIMAVFLLNGLLIGLVGAVLGAIGGLLFCDNINAIGDFVERTTGLAVFPQNIYYLDRIPVDSDPMGWVVAVTLVACTVSVLASLLPALKAARLDPVEALRYE